MATNRDSRRLRYRYGICLNDNCEKCKNKEVQQVPARKELVCQNPECGKPLSECPEPKKGINKMLIAIIAAVVVVLGIGIGSYFAFFSKPSGPELVGVDTVTVDLNIYQITTYKNGDEITKDSVLIGQVERTRELISTDTITVGTSVVQVKTYQNGDAIEQDSLVIGQEIRELVKTDTITIGKSIMQVRTFKTGSKVDYDTWKIGDVPEKKVVTSAPMPKVSFGTYSGPQSGLDGEIRVTRSYSLDLRNSSHETIELRPGDVITHTKFKNGDLVSGYWKRGTQGRSFHR